MRTYKLDTTNLPNVWVTWATTKNKMFDKRYWLNCQTGKKKTTPESWMFYRGECDIDNAPWNEDGIIGMHYKNKDDNKVWVKSGSKVYRGYAKYHKDIDRLEIAVVTIDTSRSAGVRVWEYAGDRFFVGKDKSIIDHNGNLCVSNMFLYSGHYAYNKKDLLRVFLRTCYGRDFVVDEFKKFIGGESFTIGNGSSVDISHTYHIQHWYETVQKSRSKGKQQKFTDELVSMPLSSVENLAEKYPAIDYTERSQWHRAYNLKDILYYDGLEDGWSALRYFSRNENNTLKEKWRMYINDDGRSRIVAESNGDWIPSIQIRCQWGRRGYFANQSEAIESCNRIKYILSSLDYIEQSDVINFVITALRFPEIEQLAKLGCTNKLIGFANGNSPKADIKNLFAGYFNDKEKSLLRKVGMTKYQFDKYMQSQEDRYSSYESRGALRSMRKMFGNDLSPLDDKSFDRYFAASIAINRSFHRSIDSYVDCLNLDLMRFFKNIVRLGEKNRAAYGLLHDTLYDYQCLNYGTTPDVDWYFDNYSDLVRTHDAITELKRMQDNERRALWNKSEAERMKAEEKKREELDKNRSMYEYDDDNYIIRLPKTLSEIVTEGSAQRICIGGYTSRHATGATNIFFLRKKSEPDVPFYAIEMSNSKNIVQIHGYCNEWLGRNPDAIPTVVRWLRKNGIACNNKILTCTAKGYGACNDYVPMPVVD